MTDRAAPAVFSIPAGVPFLHALADAFLTGRLVPSFSHSGDPLALAEATIYVPTRRAARELRSVFVDRLGGRSAILPTIRPLGEFEEDDWLFDAGDAAAMDLAPPVPALDRILLLAPLVQAWKKRLPAHLAQLYDEDLVVPASLSDAIWLSRDLAALMDEIETESADWSRLADLVPAELAGWWQVTLDFLQIVTTHWPNHLADRDRSNPAAYRSAMILAEAQRLIARPPSGPVIAAGSTGSIPATARLLSAISQLPNGAVVLPGLDRAIDERSWSLIGRPEAPPSIHGHPQTGLKKLLGLLGIERADVADLGRPEPAIAARIRLVGEALRPAETTEAWAHERREIEAALAAGALSAVTQVEAANEREEALAIAVALRLAVDKEGRTAALVTGDRDLARRVCAELRRFGIQADDSAGTLLSVTPPAALLRLLVETTFRPGDPVAVMALLKHPLVGLGLPRHAMRRAAETIDLVALRGGSGRPDVVSLAASFQARIAALDGPGRQPFWRARIGGDRQNEAEAALDALREAVAPLAALRGKAGLSLPQIVRSTVEALENVARGADGDVGGLYRGDAGERLADFLRGLVGAESNLGIGAGEWPDILAALISGETVRPSPAGDPRVSIWGTLEARLQTVDTVVIGGLNEGSWPRKAEPDRFMSRMMKSGLDLDPPERRIGQAAHDFVMAMGMEKVVLTRSARSGDAPAVASRWLQRLLTCAGAGHAEDVRERGRALLHWARLVDERPQIPFAPRPEPRPPLEARPKTFSVTEIETLRRDPYAVYARRILRLMPLDPLLRDPGAAERGTLFHDILHRFSTAGIDPAAPDAVDALVAIGRASFAEAALPEDVEAIWWPRFARLARGIVEWERGRPPGIRQRSAEARAHPTAIGATGATLSGYADRIDLRPAGMADILDFKTGATPSKGQAHTLLAPQLALEGALLMKGGFADIGSHTPSELAYVRLKANGKAEEESILQHNRQIKSAEGLSLEAWERLEKLIAHYGRAETGYRSRALPFREGDYTGDYDHLARVLEWSAGSDADSGGEEP